MSDNLKFYDEIKFRDLVEVGSRSSNLNADFINKDTVIVTLDIKYSFLRELYKAKNSFENLTYTEILNSQLQVLQLVQCSRLEGRLYKISSSIAQTYSKNSGGKQKAKLDDKIKKLAIYSTEVVNSNELVDRLNEFSHENVLLTEKCRQLLENLSKTLGEKNIAENENQSAAKTIQTLEEKLETSQNELHRVHELFKTLSHRETNTNNYENQGKLLDEVSSSQRSRKLQNLKQNVTNALWFSETFGLHPSSVTFRDSTGVPVCIDIEERHRDVEKMKEVLFIMDRFKISDQAYHELAVMSETLPKLHSVVNVRNEMNDSFEIHRTPGNTPGAYVSLLSEIKRVLGRQKEIPDKIQIKVSGDGTKVSRISNYVVLSFSLLKESAKLSSSEQLVLAIVKTSEKYDTLGTCLNPVFYEINALNAAKEIEFNEKKVKIEMFFGGDMKFLQICLGLGSSTGEFACPWCKVSKTERSDTSKVWDFYHSDDMKRSITEISKISEQSKKLFGVKFKPLICIEPCRIIPDELHLLLRIFDVLLRNLIDDAIDKDVKEEASNGKSKKANITELVAKIKSCGVSFYTWSSKSGEGLDWTSLTGNDVKKVLRNLPDKLFFIINHETHDTVVKIWKDFWKLYELICSDICETKNVEVIFTQAKDWVDTFLTLGGKRKGFAQKNVTPYIHCLLYHVPYFIHHYGSLRQFSGQPTEKINDEIKSIHHQKTNRYDCALDALKVRKRVENTGTFVREKRCYNKQRTDYWEDTIHLARSRRRKAIDEEIKKADIDFSKENIPEDENDLENLSSADIKRILKEHGVTTKIRKHDKLLELLKNTVKKN